MDSPRATGGHVLADALLDPPRLDVTRYLTVWLVLLFGISAQQVIGPLGAIGTPALIVAGGGAFAWVASRVLPLVPTSPGFQPLRPVLLGYVWYVLATIVLAHTRRLSPLEQSGSVREAITLLALAGVAMLVMDGLTSIARLTVLMRRLVWAATALSVVGIIQFATGVDIVPTVPGLSANSQIVAVGERSIFNRPFGTTLHPIEFGVVTAALFPLAIWATQDALPGASKRWAMTATATIGLAIPLSISRSGIVAMVAALAVTVLGWTWRERLQGLVIGVCAVPVLWLSIPGLVGTFQSMFMSVDHDPSIQARLERVPQIMDIIRSHPLFGLGAGTYSVEDYFLVDNEFWVSTMELGIIGIFLTYAVFAFAMTMAITSQYHAGATESTRRLGYAISAGILGLAVSSFTFDAFFYHIYRGVLFLLLGAAGGLWRLTRQDRGKGSTIAGA